MPKYLLALYAVQASGVVVGLDAASEWQWLFGLVGLTPSRSICVGLVFAQASITCIVAYEEWRKEREARERLSR